MGCSSSKEAKPEPSSVAPLPVESKAPPSRGSRRVVPQRDSADAGRLRGLKELNRKVDKDMPKLLGEHNEKAIFLGTGESGKSTVFKQMRLCYGQGFTDYERKQYSKIIWADTIRSIRLLADICDAERRNPEAAPELLGLVQQWLGAPGEPHMNDINLRIIQSLNLTRSAFLQAEENADDRTFLYNYIKTEPVNRDEDFDLHDEMSRTVISKAMQGIPIITRFPESIMESHSEYPLEIPISREVLGDVAQDLWESCPPAIRLLVENNQIALETNAAYFLSRLRTLREPSYSATNEDILSARIKTTGITEAEFKVKKSRLLVMDVGGQRIERSKWIHNFDDVTCVLFVVSVSEYDQVLDEDKNVNRLDEALEVFNQTVNSRWFKSKSVQLFLNKTDVLAHKCQYSSFKARFRGFRGNNDSPEDIIAYIEGLFKSRFIQHERNLYVHRTCATDTTSMKFVINAVSDMILFENMKWAGMI